MTEKCNHNNFTHAKATAVGRAARRGKRGLVFRRGTSRSAAVPDTGSPCSPDTMIRRGQGEMSGKKWKEEFRHHSDTFRSAASTHRAGHAPDEVHLKEISSTSNLRVAFCGITGGIPAAPYAKSGVAVNIARWPTLILAMPSSLVEEAHGARKASEGEAKARQQESGEFELQRFFSPLRQHRDRADRTVPKKKKIESAVLTKP
jgi:hypothetical protein